MKKNTAFTMLEMSMVLIIIGVLVTSIIGASSMIRSARIATARSLTSKSVVSTIDGLTAWYETSMIDSFKTSEAYDKAQITTWYDISPASIVSKKNTLTKTASSTVTYNNKGINGFASVKFTGTGTNSTSDTTGKIAISSFFQGAQLRSTIFIVFSPTALPSTFGRLFIDSGNTSVVTASGMYSTSSVHFNLGSVSNTATGSNPASFRIADSYITALYFNDSSSKAYVNNTAITAGNSNVSPGSNSLTGLTIGSDRNGAYSFNGNISELIIYNRTLKDTERKEVFRYLSNKYKIPVQGL